MGLPGEGLGRAGPEASTEDAGNSQNGDWEPSGGWGVVRGGWTVGPGPPSRLPSFNLYHPHAIPSPRKGPPAPQSLTAPPSAALSPTALEGQVSWSRCQPRLLFHHSGSTCERPP